jgi:hypothetical protein
VAQNGEGQLRRVLEKGEFAAFIQSWCLGTDTDFDEMSNELIQRLEDQNFLKNEVEDAVAEFEDISREEVCTVLPFSCACIVGPKACIPFHRVNRTVIAFIAQLCNIALCLLQRPTKQPAGTFFCICGRCLNGCI